MNTYSPTRFAEELVSRLRGEIARFDINQAQIALLCGVSQSQFSKIIRGIRPMTLDQVAVICEALDIDISDICSEVEQFVNEEGSHSSPVVFVQGARRVGEEPARIDFEELDEWGRAVAFEWDTSPEIVGGSGDDVESQHQRDQALAAKKRSKHRGETYND